MKIIAPTYYNNFHCIAEKCSHTCCKGWEIDIDNGKLEKYLSIPEIAKNIDTADTPHFILQEEERCPFLNENNLCNLIINYTEDILCQICRDHPRFRNYWSDGTEIGIGLVCEEASRIILSSRQPMQLTVIEDDGITEEVDEDELWLRELRNRMLSEITETGPSARLLEYLIFRHLPNALYDGRIDERIAFIRASHKEITDIWANTDSSLESLVDTVIKWSYDVEYDEEETEKRIASFVTDS